MSADPLAIGAEVEALIDALSRSDQAAAAPAQRLASLLTSYYGAALARVMAIVQAERGGGAIADRLRADPLVGSLLTLHDGLPPPGPPLIQITRSPDGHGARGTARCELCGAPVGGDHAHLMDVDRRQLLCACGSCGGAGGRFRRVPTRYARLPPLTPDEWESLELPVGLAFVVISGRLDRAVACYPGPAGAAECALPPEAWPGLVARRPDLRDLAPDVEALLVRRQGGDVECHLVPIDACFELVGRIRRTWTGLGGGTGVTDAIDRFFASVGERAGRNAEIPA